MKGNSWILFNYEIAFGESNDSRWDHFRLDNAATDTHKVHVSFDQAKLAIARPFLLKVLNKYQVRLFKIIYSEVNVSSRNVQGKELTIYLQKDDANTESNQAFWIALLTEIEQGLIERKIEPNKLRPQSDLPFPGSKGYVFYRCAHNNFNRYVSAKTIAQLGFTAIESVKLAENNIYDWFKGFSLHQAAVTPDLSLLTDAVLKKDYSFTTKQSPLIRKCIYDEMERHLKSQHMYNLLFGENKATKWQIKAPFEDFARIIKNVLNLNLTENYLNLVTKTTDDKAHASFTTSLVNFSRHIKFYFLKSLRSAAEAVALIRGHLNIDHSIGNITPAFYFYLITPLFINWKKNNSIDLNVIDKTLLIQNLVKCSFRDTSKDQIEFYQPQYVAPLTEQLLDELLKSILTKANEQCYAKSLILFSGRYSRALLLDNKVGAHSLQIHGSLSPPEEDNKSQKKLGN